MARDPALEETRPLEAGRARGLVSSRVSGARVEVRRCPPPADLTDVVECFWRGSWDLRDQPPHTSELLSDPALNIVFEAEDSRVVGVWTRLWVRTLEGRGLVRAVKLRPGAVQAFLPGQARRYANRQTPLVELDDGADDIRAQVLGAADDDAAFQILAQWLRQRRQRDVRIGQAVAAVELARRSPLTRADQLAAQLGLTERALQRLFSAHVGAPPKWVIRWLRLQEVALLVEAGRAPDLADLAYQLGYADQAHLARDFRAATRRTLRGFERDVHQ